MTVTLTIVCVQFLLIHNLVDRLNAVCVVVGNVRLRRPLDLTVDITVNDYQRIEVYNIHIAHISLSTIFDLLVLFFEKRPEGWSISTTIRFSGE